MFSAIGLLVGLAVFSATLAKPVDFVSISYTTLSATTSIPTNIAVFEREAFIAERMVSTSIGGGSTAPGWTFISCFTDEINARALLTQVQIRGGPEAMSVSQCNYRCWADGYILSGVEFAHECWCDHALNGEYHLKVPESECNMVCTGDNMETCGGANRIAIYEYSGTPALETGKPIFAPRTLAARSVDIMSLYTPIGCYEDSTTSRMLEKYNPISGAEKDMTVEICATECYNLGYHYAGLEYGDECFCDTLMRTIVKASDTDCNMACPGGSGEFCGGNLRINVYSYNVATPLTATSTTASPAAAASSTTVPTNSPITAPGAYESKGCYSDVTYNRTLGFVGSFPGSQGMTLEPCQGACKNAGYVFAGVEFGQECWCDNIVRGIGISVADGECNMACSGNKSETCGGSNRINIYSFTPTTSSTATASPSSTPVCIEYYKVAQGDYCYSIWTSFHISQEQLTTWNPSLAFPQCQLLIGQFVCVQQGPAGSTVLTITALPSTTTPSDEIPATASVLATMTMPGASTAVTPTTISTAVGATSAVSASTVSCSAFYQVAKDDYCYEIWTSFGISQDQFATWNPSLIFPQCQIFPGDFVCVQEGQGSTTTVTTLPAASTPTSSAATPTSSDSSFSTFTVSTTLTSTLVVTTRAVSSSGFLTVTPFTANSAPTSNATPITSDTTSSIGGSMASY